MQVGIKIWHRRLGHGLLKGIIGSRKAESEKVRKALEYRTYGIARPLRNLRRCGWLLIFTQKIQVRLYERLPGPHTPSAATIAWDVCDPTDPFVLPTRMGKSIA